MTLSEKYITLSKLVIALLNSLSIVMYQVNEGGPFDEASHCTVIIIPTSLPTAMVSLHFSTPFN